MNKLITLLLCFSFGWAHGQGQLVATGYTNYQLNGFDVLVQNSALTSSRLPHTNAALNKLEANLTEITGFCLSQVIIDSLKKVPIFMDWNVTEGVSQYHDDLQWLIDNNYTTKKWRCIEISNVKNFVSAVDMNQPYRVLNEMAHAYFHRVLSANNDAVSAAYHSAMNGNLYHNVQFYVGNGLYATQSDALAITSLSNYFAEMTETYFGTNNYFPFNHDEFREYDPTGYEAIKSVWTSNINSLVTVDDLTLTSDESSPEATYQWVDCNNDFAPIDGETNRTFTATGNGNYAVVITKLGCMETSECSEISTIGVNDITASSLVKAYPNPGNGQYTVSIPQQMANMTLKATAITGQTVISGMVVKGTSFTVDITNQPSGIYLLEIGNGSKIYRTKLIKN